MLTRFAEPAYAAMRIVVAFLYATHGAQKLFGVLGATAADLATLRGVAGIIEFFGGALLLVGFAVPYVAFLCSGQMAAAYFLSHAPQGFWPVLNRGELAALYCFVFLYIATHGAGLLSVDRALKKPRA